MVVLRLRAAKRAPGRWRTNDGMISTIKYDVIMLPHNGSGSISRAPALLLVFTCETGSEGSRHAQHSIQWSRRLLLTYVGKSENDNHHSSTQKKKHSDTVNLKLHGVNDTSTYNNQYNKLQARTSQYGIQSSLTTSRRLPLRHRRIHINMNRLRLQIILNPFHTTFASIPTLLKSTKRRLRTRTKRTVNPHCSRLDLARHSQRPRDVRRIDGRTKTVLGVVGQTDGIRFVFECAHTDDGAEDFVTVDFAVFGWVEEDGGLDECAVGAVAGAAC